MAQIKREQVAGMNIHYLYYSLDYFLDAQARTGLRSIELWSGAPHFWLDYMTYSDCKVVRQKVEERGMKVVVLTPENCTYQYQFASQEPDMFEKSFKYFSNGIKAAAELGCNIMAINSGWGYHNEDPNEAWKRSREMLSRLSEVAKANNITLTMEALRPEESRIVNNLQKTKRMFDEVNHPNLRVMVDTTAMTVAGEKLKDWFEVFGDNIKHMHFIDSNPYGHLIWGDGLQSLEEYIQTINDYGYTGYLGQEITDFRYFDDPSSHDLRNVKNFEKFMRD